MSLATNTPPQPVLLQWAATTNGSNPGGAVTIDASITETHTANAQVTEHQVETGANTTDYIRPLPLQLSLEGIITNTPVQSQPDESNNSNGVVGNITATAYMRPNPIPALLALAGTIPGLQSLTLPPPQYLPIQYSGLFFQTIFDRAANVYQDLSLACLSGALFTITTTLTTYQSMAATNFQGLRNALYGNSLKFNISFTQIRIVDTVETTTFPTTKVPLSRNQKKQSVGAAPPAAASPLETSSAANVFLGLGPVK